MNKLFIKFSVSFVLILNTLILIIFFEDLIYIVEDYLFPLFFLYFIIDSFSVLFPIFNNDIYSAKMYEKLYIPVDNYDQTKLKEEVRRNNLMALLIFLLYSGLVVGIGLIYLNVPIIDRKFIYLAFFILNFADYFCIMIWCPFKQWFLKNECCNTCRISNWDRLMKFSILIFIPNAYTISIFVIGVLIFLHWEYQHLVHPERFYRISNKRLWCSYCDKVSCGKNRKKKE